MIDCVNNFFPDCFAVCLTRINPADIQPGDRVTVSPEYNAGRAWKDRLGPAPLVLDVLRPSETPSGIAAVLRQLGCGTVAVDIQWITDAYRGDPEA